MKRKQANTLRILMQLVEETHYKLFNWERRIYRRKAHLALITSILQDAVEQKVLFRKSSQSWVSCRKTQNIRGQRKASAVWRLETGTWEWSEYEDDGSCLSMTPLRWQWESRMQMRFRQEGRESWCKIWIQWQKYRFMCSPTWRWQLTAKCERDCLKGGQSSVEEGDGKESFILIPSYLRHGLLYLWFEVVLNTTRLF